LTLCGLYLEHMRPVAQLAEEPALRHECAMCAELTNPARWKASRRRRLRARLRRHQHSAS
jgi:hypothetical protein